MTLRSAATRVIPVHICLLPSVLQVDNRQTGYQRLFICSLETACVIQRPTPASLPATALANGIVDDRCIAFPATARRIPLKIVFTLALGIALPRTRLAQNRPLEIHQASSISLDIGVASTDASLSQA